MPVPVLEKPGMYSLELLDQSGEPIESISVRVTDAHYLQQNVAIGKSTAALKPSPGEYETVNSFRETASPTRYWGDSMQLPVPGCLTSPFGSQRLFNGKPTGDFHAGLDQRGAEGTPIHAVTGGVVKIVHEFNLRGGTVAIDHGQGVETIYMHMSKTAATEGQQVAATDVIGYVGATGRANGPHLHWTLYVNGLPVNPAQWVKVPEACPARVIPKKKKHSQG
jgi:murein DD-endopeptidase MepM/ murein hydrolase activator NlpD